MKHRWFSGLSVIVLFSLLLSCRPTGTQQIYGTIDSIQTDTRTKDINFVISDTSGTGRSYRVYINRGIDEGYTISYFDTLRDQVLCFDYQKYRIKKISGKNRIVYPGHK